MGTKENKATLKRYYDEVFNGGDLSHWDDLMDPGYVSHVAGGPEYKGLEGGKQRLAASKAALSDAHITIDELVAEGDTVVIRGYSSGKNTGEVLGNPPTGKSFKAAYVAFYYFKNGKIAEGWAIHDRLGRYQQLGITPPAAPAAPARR